MHILGYALFIVGFLIGALSTVVDATLVEWKTFAAAMMCGIIGIILIKRAGSEALRVEGKVASSLQQLSLSLQEIVTQVSALANEKDVDDPYVFHEKIDATLPQPISQFVASRRMISHAYGLQAYADIMSVFAAGERALNRVWSASADGYIDEVRTYLHVSLKHFQTAHAAFHALESKA